MIEVFPRDPNAPGMQRRSEAVRQNLASRNARATRARQETIAQAFQRMLSCCHAGHHDCLGRRDLVD